MRQCAWGWCTGIIQLGHKDLLLGTWSRAHRQHPTSSGHFLPSQGYYLQLTCSVPILWLKEYDSYQAKTSSLMLSDTAGMGEAWMNKDPVSPFLQHPHLHSSHGARPQFDSWVGKSHWRRDRSRDRKFWHRKAAGDDPPQPPVSLVQKSSQN